MRRHVFVAFSLLAAAASAQVKVRLREITQVSNVRSNFLHGVGLVVGLANTGDGGKVAQQDLANFLQRMGMNVAPEDVKSQSIALVTLTAELPPYARNGQRLDVQLATAGDAQSLFGGTLLQAELMGPDRKVYALAQGPVSIGGFAASGSTARVTRGHPTVGRIPGGAIVETEVKPEIFNQRGELDLILLHPSWKNAQAAAEAINKGLGTEVSARAMDHTTVCVAVPRDGRAPERVVDLLSRLGDLTMTPDQPSKVVVNEKTGTVIVGENVRVSPCVVALSELTIQVIDEQEVVQPPAGIANPGTTEKVQRTKIEVKVGEKEAREFKGGSSLSDVMRSLKALEATPRQMIEVFKELSASGYLHAELVIQ